MNKDDKHAGPQPGSHDGGVERVEQQQNREHPNRREARLDEVVAGLAAELRIYDSQVWRCLMYEVLDSPGQFINLLVARHVSGDIHRHRLGFIQAAGEVQPHPGTGHRQDMLYEAGDSWKDHGPAVRKKICRSPEITQNLFPEAGGS